MINIPWLLHWYWWFRGLFYKSPPQYYETRWSEWSEPQYDEATGLYVSARYASSGARVPPPLPWWRRALDVVKGWGRRRVLAGMALLAGVLVYACAAPAEAPRASSNLQVEVEVLLTVDGYRVYRFYDAGEYHYFVTPQGTALTTAREYCGRGCTRKRVDEIATLP